jgi:hypothetical protein
VKSFFLDRQRLAGWMDSFTLWFLPFGFSFALVVIARLPARAGLGLCRGSV